MDSEERDGVRDPGESGARSGYWDGPALLWDGKEAKARSVTVVIRDDGMEILGEAGPAARDFPAADLRILEKHAGGFFRIGLGPFPGVVVEIRDDDALRWMERLGTQGRGLLAGFSLAGKAGVLLGAFAAVFAIMYFIGLDMAVDGAVSVIPPKVDRMLGNAVAERFVDKVLVPTDSLAVRALKRSEATVMAMIGSPEDTIRILVVPDTSIKNAFAFPGGTILVYTGMLRLLEDQEEWFGLLAHEGGHVYLRHGMRGIVRGSILGIGMSLLFGDLSGISAVVIDNAGSLLRLKYGRKDEAAADAFAQARMPAAGYSAQGLARLLRKFLALEKQPKWAAFLSTHPATEERIARLGGTGPSAQKPPAKPARKGRLQLTAEEWSALLRL